MNNFNALWFSALVAAGLPPASFSLTPNKVVCCNNELYALSLSCDDGVIAVLNGKYKSDGGETCDVAVMTLSCDTTENTGFLQAKCDDCRSCEVTVEAMKKNDECFNNYESVVVEYHCVVNKGVSPGLPPVHLTPNKVVSCNNVLNILRLSCDDGVIAVLSGKYKNDGKETCDVPVMTLSCDTTENTAFLQAKCDGRSFCEVMTEAMKENDDCFCTYKSIEVEYHCVVLSGEVVACENSIAHLRCAGEKKIHILEAEFGRADSSICSAGRQDVGDQSCSSPMAKCVLKQKCNGESECKVKVVEQEFGNPCPGVYKYLRVLYDCVVTL